MEPSFGFWLQEGSRRVVCPVCLITPTLLVPGWRSFGRLPWQLPCLDEIPAGLAFCLAVGPAIVAAVVLTRSRNAIASLPLALPWVMGPAQWWWLLPLLLLASVPLLLAVIPGVPAAIQQWAEALLPDSLRRRLVEGQSNQSLTRVAQWRFGLELISQRPWLGWGAAAFSVLYPIHAQRKWHGHSHNLPIELGVSHGWPVAVLVVGMVWSC